MDINQIHNGSGDNIAGNKIIITPKEPPYIISTRLSSFKKCEDGYQYIFFVVIGKPYFDFKINVQASGSKKTIITKEPSLQRSGTRTYVGGSVFYNEYLLSVYVDVQLVEKDFTFSVKV